jgi:hypothetical protein
MSKYFAPVSPSNGAIAHVKNILASRRLVVPVAFAFASLLAACSTGTPNPVALPTSSPTPVATATPTPTPAPTPAARLYVAGAGATANTVAYFTAPFTATSTATAAITTTSAQIAGLLVDTSGNVIVTDIGASTVASYTRPTPTTSQQFSISIGAASGMAYGPAGTFYLTQLSEIETAPTPLSASTVFTPLIASGLSNAWGITFDSAGNLYVLEYTVGRILAYAPPYTGAPFADISTGGADMESLSYDSTTNQVIAIRNTGALVYNLPLTDASTPSASIAATFFFIVGATDKNGNLYVGTAGRTIEVYQAPFSNSSQNILTIPLANAPAAMAFGT